MGRNPEGAAPTLVSIVFFLHAPQHCRLSHMRGCQARLHLAGNSGITGTQIEMGARHMVYIYLAIAIVAEVTATAALKASDEFNNPIPSIVVVVGYSISFYFLATVLRTLPVGVTYAIWSGLGIVLVALVAVVVFRQVPDTPAILGMALIVSGVVVINLFSNLSDV